MFVVIYPESLGILRVSLVIVNAKGVSIPCGRSRILSRKGFNCCICFNESRAWERHLWSLYMSSVFQVMFSIAVLFRMSENNEEEVFLTMFQFSGRFQYKNMLARGCPHMLYLLKILNHFMEHFMLELPDDMEGQNCINWQINSWLWHWNIISLAGIYYVCGTSSFLVSLYREWKWFLRRKGSRIMCYCFEKTMFMTANARRLTIAPYNNRIIPW